MCENNRCSILFHSYFPHFATYPGETGLVQPFGLDDGNRDVPIEPGIVGEVHPLTAPFSEEAPHLVTASAEGDGQRGRHR